MAGFAEALIQSGQQALVVQRQYAQALIDLGYLTPRSGCSARWWIRRAAQRKSTRPADYWAGLTNNCM
jgi:hypothetical protein